MPTLLLWVVFFMSLLDLYFLSNWLPTVLNDLGASVSAAAVIGSMLQVGGVVGTFALGSVIDRFSFRALALVYFIAVFAVGAIGQLGHSVVLRHAWRSSPPASASSAARSPPTRWRRRFYPTSVRATGVGWALGIGRVGSIVGPLVGGALLTAKWSTGSVFMAAAAAALCAALAAFCAEPAGRHGRQARRGRASASSMSMLRHRPAARRRTSNCERRPAMSSSDQDNKAAQSRDRRERSRARRPSATSASASGRSRSRSSSA